MLIKEIMSSPVITINPEMPIQEALELMKSENIRRTPVLKKGKLVGIISDYDLLNASPSQATSLSVFELNYLISKITADEVMTKEVITVAEDTPIEEAARIMADSKVGGLPVMRKGDVVGIVTETDLFRVLLELMGAREPGVRLTVLMEDKPGELVKLAEGISALQGNIIAMAEMAGKEVGTRKVMLKIAGLDEKQVKQIVEQLGCKIKDLRVTG
jgi:acetoin utilization protein AcuB